MDANLPAAFQALRSLRPGIVHYKTCSTFDSSPEIGSIGRAIDIGHRTFQNRFVPVVVGVPRLQRFCVFGNLFARSGLSSIPYRLDRHPTMQCHPVTPMTESDLRVHLSQQTSRPIALIDLLALQDVPDHARNELDRAVRQAGSIVLFDALTDDHLATIGRLICEAQAREQKPLFVAGSSGIEDALVKHWRLERVVATAPCVDTRPSPRQVQPADGVVVVSGSCAPVTARQIAWALERGYSEVRLDAAGLCQSTTLDTDASNAVQRILSALDQGASVIAHTGPPVSCLSAGRRKLGTVLGRILRDVVGASKIRRVAVVGGDTVGDVARSLEIDALEMIAPLQPGAPLCVARSRRGDTDGLEVVFKGGQVGYDDFFGALRAGTANHSTVGAMQ
jgi:uncharacterized protein YgbK (DUF1537 family)